MSRISALISDGGLRVAVYYLAFAALGLSTASIGPTLPDLADQVGVTLGAAGVVFSFRAIGRLAGTYVARIIDRLPGHRVLAGALVIIAFSMLLTANAPVLWLLAGIFALLGFGEGLIDVGGNTLLLWSQRDNPNLGSLITGLHLCFGIGALLAPFIIAQVMLATDSVAWVYRVLAVIVLLAMILPLRLPSPQARRRENAEGEQSAPFDRRLLLMLAALFMLYVGAESGFAGWVFSYAREQDLANETEAAYLTSVYWAMLTVGRLLTVPLALRYKPRTILLSAFSGAILMLVLMLVWQGAFALWLGTFGFGLMMAAIFPTALAFSEKTLQLTGSMASWLLFGAGLGAVWMPWLIGLLFEPVGPPVMLVLVLAVLVVDVALFLVLMRRADRLVLG